MKKPRKSKNLTFTEGVGWIALVLVSFLVIVYLASINRGRGSGADRTRAIGHASQIKIALNEFEDEYGLRPGARIMEDIPGAQSHTANDCFRQIIQGTDMKSEETFYSASRISQKPDRDIGDESNNYAQACAAGEVGFLYVDAPFAKSSAPIIAAPLYDSSGKFDYEQFEGKAIILKVDGSVDIVDIDKDTGRIYIEVDGKKIDMFSKENPAFGKEFSLKFPVPRKKR